MSNFLDYLNFHQVPKKSRYDLDNSVEEAWRMTGVHLRNAINELKEEHPELAQEPSN